MSDKKPKSLSSAQEAKMEELTPFSFSNRTLPKDEYKGRKPGTQRISNAGLNTYRGEWGKDQIRHLLRRAMFGVKQSDLQALEGQSMSSIINQLFAEQPAPPPPLSIVDEDPDAPLGSTWVNAPFNFELVFRRLESLASWQVGLMIDQNISIREKMTLFWHNHFVTEALVVIDGRFSYQYISKLRASSTGNFKQLTKDITTDPAMLIYLNGTENIVGAPNENYARELFELFTIGKGPQIGEGNYTTYTEQDVLAASKVLTGWVADREATSSYFVDFLHDTSEKVFSEAFDNRVISDSGANEYEILVDMIFEKEETARKICRDLYQWFVYYVIDDFVEESIIEPMAKILRENDFEIEPVLRALLSSEHFYDVNAIGCMIKNPADYAIGLFRQYDVEFPDGSDVVQQYHMWGISHFFCRILDMEILAPPGVAGWPAYYQQPLLHELWINSVTMPYRKDIGGLFVSPNGYDNLGFALKADPLKVVQQVISDPADANVFISDLAEHLFPIPISDSQKAFLKDVLRPGIPDSAWYVEWLTFTDNLDDPERVEGMRNRIGFLLYTLMGFAEYHLS